MNRFFVEPRVCIKYLFNRPSGGQLLQNQLDGDARTGRPACEFSAATLTVSFDGFQRNFTTARP
jgi:hypothetical protein